MFRQARERNTWIPNASIKLPCTYEGLKAAAQACREFPINITLVFSQSQAAAAYEATRSARYPVFISPFVGRLDDRGENGMQIIANILKMYQTGDGHVEVLTASVRSIEHILYALHIGSNIITIPFKIFKEWGEAGFRTPYANYIYRRPELADIAFQENIGLGLHWTEYDIKHELTTAGINRYWEDWKGLLSS
jgi:transaldolase